MNGRVGSRISLTLGYWRAIRASGEGAVKARRVFRPKRCGAVSLMWPHESCRGSHAPMLCALVADQPPSSGSPDPPFSQAGPEWHEHESLEVSASAKPPVR